MNHFIFITYWTKPREAPKMANSSFFYEPASKLMLFYYCLHFILIICILLKAWTNKQNKQKKLTCLETWLKTGMQTILNSGPEYCVYKCILILQSCFASDHSNGVNYIFKTEISIIQNVILQDNVSVF